MPEQCIPPLKQYEWFWSCLENIKNFTVPSRISPVFVNYTTGPDNIFFMVRDLVAEKIKFLPYHILANRILEPMKNDANNKNGNNGDEKKRVYILRVYIISYAPLTIEIHCRGRCPIFLFEIFKCTRCSYLFKRYQLNDWLIPFEEGNDSWEEFVCRVKRIPVNSHQVLSYNGPKQKPDNCEEVNHIFVIRGDFKSTNICPCIRECKPLFDQTHLNTFKLKRGRAPTLWMEE
uniref:Uncharacterized protein n=1 Tax=Panagrolaimus davidi TaxID=227884 RepID=A0A914Q2F7_9BILA